MKSKRILKPVEAVNPEGQLLISIMQGYVKEWGAESLMELFVKSVYDGKIEGCEISDLVEVLFDSERNHGMNEFKYLDGGDVERITEELEDEIENIMHEKLKEEGEEMCVAGIAILRCESLAEEMNIEAFRERLKANPYQPMLF